MMNKSSKEKRQQLILVILLTVLGLGVLWFGLINFQQNRFNRLTLARDAARADLEKVEKAIKNADQLEADVEVFSKKLQALEEEMAPGDVYLWMVNTIRGFKLPYKVEIPQFSQPEVKDMTLLPKFPYKQATLTVGGTGYYHDFGRFIADFENRFPHFRVMNLDLEPMPGVMGGDREKLSFKMDVVTLIKPGTS
jgi:hypothetical protein